jgi:DHA1 family multidrug resistance protein-like MFS transporter
VQVSARDRVRVGAATTRRLLPLFACVLIVMLGVGITLPVLPLYVERLALGSGASERLVGIHIGMLTAAYPMTQLVFAPLWGRLSDRLGRLPLIVVGIIGFALSQLLFGIASGVALLYLARLAGGALSSALLPVAAAYVADATTPDHRAHGMSWLNAAVGVGTLVGPAIGGFASGADVHLRAWGDHLRIDAFSVPFCLASALAIVALVLALIRIPGTRVRSDVSEQLVDSAWSSASWLLVAAGAGYLAITLFEATFSLFAIGLGFRTADVGAAFAVCGGTMLIAQLGGPALVEKHGESRTIAIGFGSMSLGMLGLVVASGRVAVFAAIAMLGAGMALLGPSLASVLSRRRSQGVGAMMGLQQSAQSVGQIVGAVLGVILFGWSTRAPYVTGAVILVIAGLAVWSRQRSSASVSTAIAKRPRRISP